jgi:hypothetical protein
MRGAIPDETALASRVVGKFNQKLLHKRCPLHDEFVVH